MKWILNIYKWILAQCSVNCNLSSTIFVKLQHDNVKSSFWIWSIRDPVSQVNTCMEVWISSGDRDLVAQLHTQWYIPPLTSHARLLAPLYSPQPPPPANFSPCVCQPWTSTKNPLNLRLQVWPKAFHCASYCWSCPRGQVWFQAFHTRLNFDDIRPVNMNTYIQSSNLHYKRIFYTWYTNKT